MRPSPVARLTAMQVNGGRELLAADGTPVDRRSLVVCPVPRGRIVYAARQDLISRAPGSPSL